MIACKAWLTTTRTKVHNEQAYMDKNFNNIEQTLMGLSGQRNVVGTRYQNWNHLQGEWNTIHEDIAVVLVVTIGAPRFPRKFYVSIENLVSKETTWVGDKVTNTMPMCGRWSPIEVQPSLLVQRQMGIVGGNVSLRSVVGFCTNAASCSSYSDE